MVGIFSAGAFFRVGAEGIVSTLFRRGCFVVVDIFSEGEFISVASFSVRRRFDDGDIDEGSSGGKNP